MADDIVFSVASPDQTTLQDFLSATYGIGAKEITLDPDPTVTFWKLVETSDTYAIETVLRVFQVNVKDALFYACEYLSNDYVEKLLGCSSLADKKAIKLFCMALEVCGPCNVMCTPISLVVYAEKEF
jgi:hypothetical protein